MSTVLERLDRLPRRNLTVLALKGISTLVPGGWHNTTSADELISSVMGTRHRQTPGRSCRHC